MDPKGLGTAGCGRAGGVGGVGNGFKVLVWCVGIGVGSGAENWGGLIGLGSIG
jgi:hypothetical protein